MFYDKKHNPVLYEEIDVVNITRLYSDIKIKDGFLEALRWEENPRESSVKLAKTYAQETLELIKKFRSKVPQNIRERLTSEKALKSLESLCNSFLSKGK